MQESSLVKWVDELQGQIDSLKRDIQSIPVPSPYDPECYVFACGHATLTVTDTPVEDSNDNEFTREAIAEFDVEFDTDNYDYYIGFDYASIDVSGTNYYAHMSCNQLKEEAPLSGDVLPVLSQKSDQGVETCAVAGVLDTYFSNGADGVYIDFVSNYGDGTGIAPDATGVSTIDYVIFAKKKTESRTKKKKSKK